MCGIVGRLAWDGPRGPGRPFYHGLLGLIAHRGPDDAAFWSEGPFFLGSPSAVDHRPRFRRAADGYDGRRPGITFNGEIYNYRELRASSRGSVTPSARARHEGPPRGYGEWGEGLLPRLRRPKFAFAGRRRRDRSLFLARDPSARSALLHETRIRVFASSCAAAASLPLLAAANRTSRHSGLSLPELRGPARRRS